MQFSELIEPDGRSRGKDDADLDPGVEKPTPGEHEQNGNEGGGPGQPPGMYFGHTRNDGEYLRAACGSRRGGSMSSYISANVMANLVPLPLSSSMVPFSCSVSVQTSFSPRESVARKSSPSGKPFPSSHTVRR